MNFNSKIINDNLHKLLKGFFNMYTKDMDKKIGVFPMSKSKRSLSGNKIWVSKPEIKQTNDTMNLNIYIYSRKVNTLIKSFKNKYLIYYLKGIKVSEKIKSYDNILKSISSLKVNNNNINNIYSKYIKHNVYINVIKDMFIYELRLLQYKQYIAMYESRFNNIYITPLKKLINRIYRKKMIFNIINLKNYFLDSNIITQVIASKAKKRENKISVILKVALTRVRPPVLSKNLITRERSKLIIKNNYSLKDSEQLIDSNNDVDKFLIKMYNPKNNLDQEVLNLTKNKLITGIRLRASGRLTRRFTAQRSVSNLKYKGTTKNVDSSYKGFSSKLLKNNLRSNLQFTEIKSKNRVGAFGIKGWTSSI
jgi:hypothetical protein